MDPALSFRLFGPFEVYKGHDSVIEVATPKQRALLALLTLEPGRVVSLDRLVDELWKGEAPSAAISTLRAYISQLRRVLEPDRRPRTPPAVLLTREPGYVLAVPPEQVDIVRFGAAVDEGRRALQAGDAREAVAVLGRALELWHDEPLAEFTGYDFAQPVVARLAEQRATAVEGLFSARLALGEAASCVADLERWVEVHPYRERLWGLLVLALYRAGRQADALGALRRVRELLADELGLEPGPELRELEQAVFEQSPELAAPSRLPVPPPPAAPPEPAASAAPHVQTASGSLVAREAQLRRITERLADVRRGRGGVLLMTGEAGIGKTRLAQAAADEAAAGSVAVAWGRCADDLGAPAFWPWQQIFRELGSDDVLHLLADGAGPLGEEHGTSLFELHARVAEALPRTPTLIVLDDLHWADAASLRLVAHVAGELHRLPVLLLVTLRPEPLEDLRDVLGTLARQPGAERIAVPPFTRADVSAYLGQRELTDPALAEALYERTSGNPFYLGELLRLLDSEHGLDAAVTGLPEGVREVLGRRVGRLPAETRELLRTAAVLGRDVELDALSLVSGLPDEEAMSRLEPAVVSGLLAELQSGFDYRFSHPLVRDVIYAELSRLQKARMHLRVGEALELLPALDETARLTALAHHFGMATRVGGAAKAVDYAVLAARHATAQCAYDEAVGYWRKALDALGAADSARRCELLVQCARALRDVSDTVGAREVLQEAIGLASRLGDRTALAEALTVFGSVSVWNWRPYGVVDGEAVALLERLLDEPLSDRHRAAVLGTLGVELNYHPDRRAEGEELAREGVELARRLGDPALLVQVLNNYMVASWVPERERERHAAANELLAVRPLPASAELVGLVQRMAQLLRFGALEGWDRDRARAALLAGRLRNPELTSMVMINEAARYCLDGDWSALERVGRELDELFGDKSMWGLDYVRLGIRYTAARAQGRVRELLGELVEVAGRSSNDPLRPLAILAALDCDEEKLARSLVARWGTEIPGNWSGEFLSVVWSHITLRLGTHDPAELYARLAPYADRLVVGGSGTTGWGSTHLILARLAQALGDGPGALEHARRAHETHKRLGLAYWARESELLLAALS